MKVQWRQVLKYAISRVTLGFTVCALIAAAAVVLRGQGQSQPTYPADALTMPSVMTRDPWFWVLAAWWCFSAAVTGMPEPTQASSPWYIWAYRTFHILAASGTSYFQNKMHWPRGEG